MYLVANRLRVVKVAKTFKDLGGLDFAKVFEEVDPQMAVARRLCNVANHLTPLLYATNACVSYLLTGRGEEYWSSFAEYVINSGKQVSNYLEVVELVKEFVSSSRYHVLARAIKLSRLSKLLRCKALKEFEDPNLRFINDPTTFLRTLTECLGSSKDSKTVLFATKMYYYGVRACLGRDLTLPESTSIPVDRRVAYLAYTSGMVEVGGSGLSKEEVINSLMRRPKLVRDVWNDVARLSNIPPLHLDAPLWVVGRYVKPGATVEGVVKEVSELVGSRLPTYKIELLVKELLYKILRG